MTTIVRHPVLACLFLAALARGAGATTYDLQKQWSTKANPHGAWSLVQGASVLPRDKDWTAISGADAAYNPASGHIAQPAWAPGNVAGHYLPAWFKASVTPLDAAYGWKKGDVIVHTTDAFNGIGSGTAAVVFTAPSAGAATLSGNLYNARNMQRPQAWTLAVNGSVMAEGSLPGDGTFTRAHRQTFSIPNVPLVPGDTVVLTVYENGGSAGPGDFVGVDVTVALP